jgi:hypothetical protein
VDTTKQNMGVPGAERSAGCGLETKVEISINKPVAAAAAAAAAAGVSQPFSPLSSRSPEGDFLYAKRMSQRLMSHEPQSATLLGYDSSGRRLSGRHSGQRLSGRHSGRHSGRRSGRKSNLATVGENGHGGKQRNTAVGKFLLSGVTRARSTFIKNLQRSRSPHGGHGHGRGGKRGSGLMTYEVQPNKPLGDGLDDWETSPGSAR